MCYRDYTFKVNSSSEVDPCTLISDTIQIWTSCFINFSSTYIHINKKNSDKKSLPQKSYLYSLKRSDLDRLYRIATNELNNGI